MAEGRGRRRGAMGGERGGACGAVVSRRIGWWARTPTLLEARLANVAGWGEFKAGDFFRTDGIWQKRLAGERKDGGWEKIFVMGHGAWVMGGREDDFEPPRRQGRQGFLF